ncbi:MAG: hypothetical protein KatS3mg011_1452 [Acidimicrobiia bacterium]|nr:MAG: hypothetical protein KatS3mg011_1452 [Acidimicrobiia bacterium]
MAVYLEGFTARDLDLLAGLAGTDRAGLVEELRRRPWAIHDLLAHPDLFDRLFDPEAELSDVVSPFFLFAVVVHRVAAELREVTYVNDWSGPRSRLPVFDVGPLREFVDDPARVFFLAGLLASFAVPERPPVPVRGPLDLEGLAAWLDQVMPADRVVLLRRLGDLALFLAGVFPDRTGSRPLRPLDAERLGRTVGMSAEEILALCDPTRPAPGLEALESLGARWYEAAAAAAVAANTRIPPIIGDVAARFSAARRVLNHLTDRYLYRLEPRWNTAA